MTLTLFHHLLLILPLINEKAQLLLDFFDRLKEAAICRFFQLVEKPGYASGIRRVWVM